MTLTYELYASSARGLAMNPLLHDSKEQICVCASFVSLINLD